MFRDRVLSGLTNGHGGASSPVVRGVAGGREPYIASRVKKSLESVAATGSTITLGAVVRKRYDTCFGNTEDRERAKSRKLWE